MNNITERVRTVTGGVDTHADFHVAAVLDTATTARLDTGSFPATSAGYRALWCWLGSFGQIDRVGVEGTGMYGAGLTRHLQAEGVEVIEVDRPDRQQRQRDGKTDTLDAEAAARAVLGGRAKNTPKIAAGPTEAIRAIELVCHSASKDRTRAINQFHSLLVTAPAGLRESMQTLTLGKQLERARRFRAHDDIVEHHNRQALKVLATRIRFLDNQISELETAMADLAAQASPALLGVFGVGPHTAARLLATAGANPDRFTSEAQFAKLCGVCPIPASSGRTIRHRLNRGGDRRANRALHQIAIVRLRYDHRTRLYAQRRRHEGRTNKEILRCLKRFIAREIYNTITNPPTHIPTGPELRTLRKQKNQTLAHVANALGTDLNRISRLETGIDHNTTLAQQQHQWLTHQPD